MKKKILPLIIAVLVICLINTGMLAFLVWGDVREAIQSRPVVISRDYDKGQSMELALASEKPMVVFFYADWCRYCQKFAPSFKKVTNKKEIKKNFAIAYVNAEDVKNQGYMKEFNVEGYPTVYLVDKERRELVSPVDLFSYNSDKTLTGRFLEFLKTD